MRWLVDAAQAVRRTAHLMVGMPDYDTYVRHRQKEHPGEPVMTRTEFFRERTERRYGGGPNKVMRCC